MIIDKPKHQWIRAKVRREETNLITLTLSSRGHSFVFRQTKQQNGRVALRCQSSSNPNFSLHSSSSTFCISASLLVSPLFSFLSDPLHSQHQASNPLNHVVRLVVPLNHIVRYSPVGRPASVLVLITCHAPSSLRPRST